MVIVVSIHDNEPCYWRSAQTLNKLKEKLDPEDFDDRFVINAMQGFNFSGVATKFEILDGTWVIFD